MFRYRSTEKKYIVDDNDASCPFCDMDPRRILRQTDHANVTKALYPYDIWEFRNVKEHLLITPKTHAAGFAGLSAEAQAEIMQLIAEYESKGFNVYARSVGSTQRTVVSHQHTHLVKTSAKPAKLGLFVKKPYMLIKW